MSDPTESCYITTPIYYVNDEPHIGHIYTTVVADIVARFHRLRGADVFFLTGTDEHAAKVVDAAEAHAMGPQDWADRNAALFKQTFTRLGITHDDFIRTSEGRHKERVVEYVRALMDRGDVYPGEYEGWYDPGQEEYVAETKATEFNYASPVDGRPLVRKKEKNYFFALSRYQQPILELLEGSPGFVQPDARRNEVIARVKEGLIDVPISRTGTGGWGIQMPGDPEQTVYVWIDALFNYLSTVDTEERRHYWPADVHFIAKDIVWFHAVVWPGTLMALDRSLPKQVYTHSFWIAEGQKMSKSLGNFIDLEKIDGYVGRFGLDALRWFLAGQGPLGSTDADFSYSKFVEIYNGELANTIGNCVNRVTNMIHRYFGGEVPAHGPHVSASKFHSASAERAVGTVDEAMRRVHLHLACTTAMDLVRDIDMYIEETQPFRLAKDPEQKPKVGTILYNCAEALRIASVLLWPVLPGKMEEVWDRLGCGEYGRAMANRGRGDFHQWARWGQLTPGTPVKKGKALFPRTDAE